MAAPLAQSIGLPPPTAIRPSQPCRAYSATAPRTATSVGLEGTSSNTATARGPSASSTGCSTPAARTPASVTTSARVMPTRWQCSPMRASAPKSNSIWVRYWMRAMGCFPRYDGSSSEPIFIQAPEEVPP